MGKKRWKGTRNKVFAWLLTLALILTGGILPENAEQAQAADSFGRSRDYSGSVAVSITNQKDSPSNDWSGFDMSVNNNTGKTICDWIIVLQVPNGTASAFKCWNATFEADGDTIYLYPMQSGANAVLNQGQMVNNAPGGGFKSTYVDAASIKVTNVYYNIGSQSSFDYSSGETNDDNAGSGGGGSSSGADSGTDKDLVVEYNFAKLLQESLYFYDANMCGPEVKEKTGISWRKACHTDDQKVTYKSNDSKEYTVDVSGGFHDAGDHVKFGLPQGYSASMLGMSYYQFKKAYEELGQTSHLKTITDYFCDYFRRCIVYENNAKSGKVIAFCYQVGDGNADHSYWGAPENQTGSRPAYFANASNPATDEVSVAVAALAINYMNFGNIEDLNAAKALFQFAKENEKKCATGGEVWDFYGSSSWQDDYSVAAAALYAATKESSYQTEYNNNKSGINRYWVLDWANSGGMGAMLAGDWDTVKSIANVKNSEGVVLDGVFNCLNDWGSCRYNASLQFVGLVYDKNNNGNSFTTWAKSQMEYMLGANPNKRCYVVGYNENSSKYPHHRAASRSGAAGETRSDHYTLLGALVGGPTKGGVYKDDQGDYQSNEVALDYNAGLVGAAAGLYLAYKDIEEENHSNELVSQQELKDLGVSNFYGAPEESGGTPKPTTSSSAKPSNAPSTAPTPGVGETDNPTSPEPSSPPTVTQNPGSSSQPGNTPEGGQTPGSSSQPGNTPEGGQTPGNTSQPGNTPEGGQTPGNTSQPGNTPEGGQTPGNTSQPGNTPEGGQTPGGTTTDDPGTTDPGSSSQPSNPSPGTSAAPTISPSPTAPGATVSPSPGTTGDQDSEDETDGGENTTKLAKAKLKKIKAGKKKLIVTWKACKQIDGYQIQVSLKKNFAKGKKITVKSAKKKKYTVKKLKKKKKYYVRIRTWKLVNGKKVYGAWSKKKVKKTK